jgi:hypothetical protein
MSEAYEKLPTEERSDEFRRQFLAERIRSSQNFIAASSFFRRFFAAKKAALGCRQMAALNLYKQRRQR